MCLVWPALSLVLTCWAINWLMECGQYSMGGCLPGCAGREREQGFGRFAQSRNSTCDLPLNASLAFPSLLRHEEQKLEKETWGFRPLSCCKVCRRYEKSGFVLWSWNWPPPRTDGSGLRGACFLVGLVSPSPAGAIISSRMSIEASLLLFFFLI